MRDAYQFDLIYQIDISLIGSGERFQLNVSKGLSTESLSLVEKIIFRSDCSETKAAALNNTDHYHNYYRYENQNQ